MAVTFFKWLSPVNIALNLSTSWSVGHSGGTCAQGALELVEAAACLGHLSAGELGGDLVKPAGELGQVNIGPSCAETAARSAELL